MKQLNHLQPQASLVGDLRPHYFSIASDKAIILGCVGTQVFLLLKQLEKTKTGQINADNTRDHFLITALVLGSIKHDAPYFLN